MNSILYLIFLKISTSALLTTEDVTSTQHALTQMDPLHAPATQAIQGVVFCATVSQPIFDQTSTSLLSYIKAFIKYSIVNSTSSSDINECLVSNGGCHVNAKCVNTDASYYCTCNALYRGNGTFCEG